MALGCALALGALLAITSPSGATGSSVQLTAKEFLYEPKEVSASAGEITLVIKNGGAIEHNLVVEGTARKKLAEIAVIEPGTSATTKARFDPGTYAIVCTLPGHREAGMIATLKVGK